MKKYCEHSGIEITSNETHAISTDELKAAIEIAKSAMEHVVHYNANMESLSTNPSNENKANLENLTRRYKYEGTMKPQFSISIMQELIELREEYSELEKGYAVLDKFSMARADKLETLTEANAALTEANKIAMEALENLTDTPVPYAKEALIRISALLKGGNNERS